MTRPSIEFSLFT